MPALQSAEIVKIPHQFAALAAKFNIALPAPKVIDAVAHEVQS
jgi:hypothetical protein